MLVLLFAFIANPAMAEDGIPVKIRGQLVTEETKGKLVNGGLYLPARILGDALDILVCWRPETNTIMFGRQVDYEPSNPFPDKTRILINGKALEQEYGPIMENGTAFIPVKVIADAFGAQVQWDESTKTLNVLSTATYKAPVQFRIVSSELGSVSQYPYYVLIPDDWYWSNGYKSYDGIELNIFSGQFTVPLVHPPTDYMYLGRSYFLGNRTTYEKHAAILLGGSLGRYTRKVDSLDQVDETFALINRYGELKLTFSGPAKKIEEARDTINAMVETLQIPVDNPFAWGKILLARDFLNFLYAFDAEIKKLPASGTVPPEETIAKYEALQQWLAKQQTSEVIEEFYNAAKAALDSYIDYLKIKYDPKALASDIERSWEHQEHLYQIYMQMIDDIYSEIRSDFQYFGEVEFGNFHEYTWEYEHTFDSGKKLAYSVLVPENWKEQMIDGQLLITDPSGSYSFRAWVDTSQPELYEIDTSINYYTPVAYTEMLLAELEGKEILFTFEGVFWGAPGVQIMYRDYVEGIPVIKNLSYSFGGAGAGSGYELILLTFPENGDSDLEVLLWLMNDSWRSDVIDPN